ncbi:MexC family multidrug efflux RND transporter periplasmic adaptor subunit [Pseudomonas straminea]|uniref:Membrane fusion protein, multidrug efflux system n=2 Tax=Pseudomonas straminea TaxID=47882 RepID=A0A1I1WP08_PSEOC|nr:MexC family multidrug efflux RND transporter periplasmic adaptor subunit [Pseudomonas straminea]SFD96917.1 membrane fusion protein, multidrug efflux system [Pseudomonas straminea]
MGLCLCALMLSGCDSPQQEAQPEPVQVSVMTLTPQTLDVSEDLPARVAAFRTAEIRPQVGGIVQRRLFEQGADIQAGAALFEIDAAPFKAEVQNATAALKRAQAVLARARIQVERLQPLVSAEAVSQQTFDDAASQREQAAADVAQAEATLARKRLDLKYATVSAPISGRVDQAQVSEGALVSTTDTTPMATVQQIDQVYVDVRESATSLERWRHALGNRLAPGADGVPVQILDSSGKAYGLSGRILFSGISVDAGTGNVLLRVQVDNPNRQLLPGMYVLARVPRAHHTDALSVPQQAVLRRDGQASVWVLGEDEQVQRVPVELGELVGRRYRIVNGLSAGQRVVIEGLDRLAEGAPVKARLWQAGTASELASSSAR